MKHIPSLQVKKEDGSFEKYPLGTVVGVKGEAEQTYRTNEVNITKENLNLGNVDNTHDTEKTVKQAGKVTNALTITENKKFDGSAAITIDKNDITTILEYEPSGPWERISEAHPSTLKPEEWQTSDQPPYHIDVLTPGYKKKRLAVIYFDTSDDNIKSEILTCGITVTGTGEDQIRFQALKKPTVEITPVILLGDAVDEETQPILVPPNGISKKTVVDALGLEPVGGQGVNLLFGTNQGKNHWNAAFGNGVHETTDYIDENVPAVKFETKEASSSFSLAAFKLSKTDYEKLEPDTDYTLSFDIKSNALTSVNATILNLGAQGGASNVITIKFRNDLFWQKVVVTLHTYNEIPAYNDQHVYLGFKDIVGYIVIKNIKLERGTVADPVWTPAPEDIVIKTQEDVVEALGYVPGSGENLLAETRRNDNTTTITNSSNVTYYQDGDFGVAKASGRSNPAAFLSLFYPTIIKLSVKNNKTQISTNFIEGQYIFSCEFKTNHFSSFPPSQLRTFYKDSTNYTNVGPVMEANIIKQSGVVADEQWHHVEVILNISGTWQTPTRDGDDMTIAYGFTPSNFSESQYFEIKKPKLESYSVIDLNWTPSPEDTGIYVQDGYKLVIGPR